jgi:hypothetical protein
MATTSYGSPYVSGSDLVAGWPAASLTVANAIDAAGYYIGRGINAQTASYTGVLTDAGKTVTMTNAGATTFTVPANASVAYPTGTRINILNLGAGACTPTAGAGVTISGTITALATNQFAELIKTATNTWSYIPASSGKILQVVYAATTTEATNNSTATYGDSNLTATITPQSASNTVLVIIGQSYRVNGTTEANGSIKIVRASTDIWLPGVNYALSVGSGVGVTVDNRTFFSMTYLDSPATTSATTYKTQFNRNAGTMTVQPNSTRSSIILMEVSA